MNETPAHQSVGRTKRGGAIFVAAGILLSRIAGLIRERVFAHYFGNSAAADAFKAALRIPNILQNLFGEGVLSASFIPVYSGLLGKQEKRQADALGGAVFALMTWAACCLVTLGVIFSPVLVALIAPGFAEDKRELTITLTRVLFPAMGLLMLSAWCLGVLNSHRRFFLPYAAPVLWNAAIISGIIWWRDLPQDDLAVMAAWSVVAGSALQFLIQLPAVLKLIENFRFRVSGTAHLKEVLTNFVPVLFGRGVVQFSAYVDSVIASLLPTGAVAALGYMQTIYLLPIGLFGMSVSAAELPGLSQTAGSDDRAVAVLRARVAGAYRQIAFFVIPSAVAFIMLGDYLIGAVFETGRFTHQDTVYVWKVLIGGTLGLYWAASSRLLSSTFYALRDTLIPFRCSLARVALSTGLGAAAALYLPSLLGLDPAAGLIGLTASSALAAVAEYYLLKNLLERRIGALAVSRRDLALFWALALSAGAISRCGAELLTSLHITLTAITVSLVFAAVYCGGAIIMRVPEAQKFQLKLKTKIKAR